MSLCLVTGGAGFIGSHVVRGLLARGHQVRVLDNFSTGFRKNLAEVADSVAIHQADICDADALPPLMRGVDTVCHLAARASVPRSVAEPDAANRVNVTGTLALLIAARDAGVRRFVYSASSSAYGDTPTLPKREDMVPQPLSPYAVSKLAGEHYCRAFTACYGLETVALRYFNVFGPRQDPGSQYAAVIPAFVTRMARGEPPVVYGDGQQSRDFCYVDNVVNANLLGMTAERLRGEALNIACGERVTLNEMIGQINAALGTDIRPQYRPARVGDVRHSLADLSAAKQVLGYIPQVRFAEGLRRSIQWYRENLSA